MKRILKAILFSVLQFFVKLFQKDGKIFPFIILPLLGFALVSFGIWVFIELTSNLQSQYLTEFDTYVADYITSFRNPSLTLFFKYITDVGDIYGYVIVMTLITFVLLYFFKNWRYSIQLLSVLILAVSSNVVLKQIIQRERPMADHLVTVKTLSYPSGHAMTAMAFYGFLIYLLFAIKIKNWYRYGLVLVCLFMIFSIGISRIYLGVHFPSDVLGGFIAGLIWVVFCVFLLTILKIYRKKSMLN